MNKKNIQTGGGHFGMFSHDGDGPLDMLMNIENDVLPKEYHALNKILRKQKNMYSEDVMYELQKLIVKNNISAMYKFGLIHVKKLVKAQMDEHTMMLIVGVCILLSKIGQENIKFDSLPKNISKDYPPYLKNIAAKCLIKLRELLKINELGWADPKKRLKAIELEYKLFTGKNLPKENNKTDNKLNKKSNSKPKKIYSAKSSKKKNTKKLSKKSTRK